MRFSTLALLALLLPLAACGPDDAPEPPGTADAPAAEAEAPEALDTETEVTVYTVEGTVRSVTPSGRHVMIHHEDIPGFMQAMTMPFDVPNTLDVDHLERDDRITFTFEASEAGHVLREVARLDDSGS